MKTFILLWALGTDFGQSKLSVGSQTFESKEACERGGQALKTMVDALNDPRAALAWQCVAGK